MGEGDGSGTEAHTGRGMQPLIRIPHSSPWQGVKTMSSLCAKNNFDSILQVCDVCPWKRFQTGR